MLASLARALERGMPRAPVTPIEGTLGALCSAWEHFARARVVRPLQVPPLVRIVAVGGATLGGSGKTPVAIACAAELAAAGARVAFVGHAYRAAPARPRIVAPSDALSEVGDEALLAARALASCGVPVVVAPRRAQAVALGSRLANVLVLDGVAQIAPVRASLALLAVDAVEPWGRAARVPPRGDLRAPVAALLAACDMVVSVGAEGADARVDSRGAWLGATLRTWDSLAGLRVGLLSALARPERIVRMLALRGISLHTHVCTRDHGPFSRGSLASAGREPVDLWLATPKCALHVREPFCRRVATLDHRIALPEPLRMRLLKLAEHAREPSGQESPRLDRGSPEP